MAQYNQVSDGCVISDVFLICFFIVILKFHEWMHRSEHYYLKLYKKLLPFLVTLIVIYIVMDLGKMNGVFE